MSNFVMATSFTMITNLLALGFNLGTSIVLARVLGAEGRGIYALATLLPSLIVTLGNLGIGPATVYYVAKNEFRRQEILGNNVLLSIGIGGIGILAGVIVVLFFREAIFPGVSPFYLLFALALVPGEMFFSYVNYILLGTQHIKEFNYRQLFQAALFLGFVILALIVLRAGVAGAIFASLLTWVIIDVLVFGRVERIVGGVSFKLNFSYIRSAITYGLRAHLSNILGFLNYRADMFMVNWFLGPVAVGFYSVGVGLVERLWMISQAASTVLFPRVAAENNEARQKSFTPLVARTVLWTTALGAAVFVFFSQWIVLLLYSETFLPSVSALRALLPGIVTLSAGRVLANDIAGRGLPELNIYTGVAAVSTNIALNLLWIPRFGIVGAALASTVSYTVSFLLSLFFYCRLSGNPWQVVILPQRGDWALYWKVGKALLERFRTKIIMKPKAS